MLPTKKIRPPEFFEFFLKIFFFEIKIHLRSKTSKTLSKVKSLTKHKNTPFSIFKNSMTKITKIWYFCPKFFSFFPEILDF